MTNRFARWASARSAVLPSHSGPDSDVAQSAAPHAGLRAFHVDRQDRRLDR